MLTLVDNFLNRITMYRLMLYYLTVLVLAAVIFCLFKVISFKATDLIYLWAILVAISWVSNKLFAAIFKIPTNIESDYITAFILTLIITPGSNFIFILAAAVLAQASKYILAYRGKHIFNPAAIAVVITYFAFNQGASWWVGNVYMLPLVVIGGLLVVRKIQRFDLVLSFIISELVVLLALNWSSDWGFLLRQTFINSAIIYFALVMLIEPQTTPPTRRWRIVYGAIIGILFGSSFSIGPVSVTPEIALVLGNIFSFIVSSKARLKLTLKSKTKVADNIYSFVFESNRKLSFRPGQYLEWTLPVKNPDMRGNRRYFTIASSPTENEIQLGIKFFDAPSTFKKTLLNLNLGQTVLAGQLSGDFLLPKDKNIKLAFIAGGIGVTPFRSMIKYLIDSNERRPITLLYSNNYDTEFAYKEIFKEAQEKLNIKTVFVETSKTGYIDQKLIEKEIPDFKDRTFYISGSHSVVVSIEELLHSMKVSKTRIKVDFFPGYV